MADQVWNTYDNANSLADSNEFGVWIGGVLYNVLWSTIKSEFLAEVNSDSITQGSTKLFMTSAERTKLTGVETGATADQTGAEMVTAINSQLGGTTWQSGGGGAGVTDGDKGDITVSGSGATWTVDADAITYAKIQNVSQTNVILGRDSAGAGNIEEITPAAARTLLDVPQTSHTHTESDITDLGATVTLNADTSVSANAWVLDEDTMVSNSSTKVPTQQSVKSYVDTAVATAKLAPAVVATAGGDYATIGAAITAGETNIFVTNGNYTETAQINITVGNVSIVGESTEGVVVTWTGGVNGVNISGGANHRFTNMNFRGHAGMTGALIRSTQQYLVCDNMRIEDVTGAGGNGIHVTNALANIRDCQFDDIINAAIKGTSVGIRISGCEFQQIGSTGECAIQDPGNRARINENFFSNYQSGTLKTAMYFTTTNWGMTISNNLIDTTDYGVRVAATGDVQLSVIADNMFNACGASGRNIWAEPGCQFDFNTITGNNHEDNLHSVYLEAGDYNTIGNCSFRGRFSATPGGKGVYLAGNNNIVSNCVLDKYSTAIEIIAGGTANRIVLPMYGTNNGTNYTDNGTSTELVTASGSSVNNLDDLGDVTITSLASGEVLKYNGTAWVNATDATSGGGAGANPADADIVVASSGGDYTNLKDALQNATTGQVIFVRDDTAEVAIPTAVANDLTIIGKSMVGTVVDWQELDPAIPASNLKWQNITLLGGGGSAQTYSGADCTYENVRFKRDPNAAASVNGFVFSGVDCDFSDCEFISDNTSTSFYDFGFTGQRIQVKDSYFNVRPAHTLGNVQATGQNVKISNCEFELADTYTGTALYMTNRITVTDTLFIQGDRTCIAIESATTAFQGQVTGCRFVSVDKAMDLNSDQWVISNNVVFDSDNGFDIDGDKNIISNNWVNGRSIAAGVGIQILASEHNNIITGNQVTNFLVGIEINTGAQTTVLTSNVTDGNGTNLTNNGTGTMTGGGIAWSDAVNADIVPDGDGTRDLGNTTNRFAEVHADSIELAGTTTITSILDEDNMASNSATALATQQSIKAYVDSAATAFTNKGAWATATAYQVDDYVRNNGVGYLCIVAHTSGTTTEPGVGASWTTNWEILFEPPVLSKTITVENPNDDIIIMFRTDVAITVKEINAVIDGSSTPSINMQVVHDPDRSALGNDVISATYPVTSTTTGHTITSFFDPTIPANSWVWVELAPPSGTVNAITIDVRYSED